MSKPKNIYSIAKGQLNDKKTKHSFPGTEPNFS